VSANDTDRAVHDYLDGRLSDAERRAFEERLERDGDLARTVEAYRSSGRLLREETIGLPPGFHARTRARFEARHGRRLDWRRFLSWEATGVLAAAVLLTALVFPEVWERYRSRPEAPVETPTAESPAALPEPEARTDQEAKGFEPSAGRARDLEKRREEPADARPGALEGSTRQEVPAGDDPAPAVLDEVAEKQLTTSPAPTPQPGRVVGDSEHRFARRDQAVEEGPASREKQAAPSRYAEQDAARDRDYEKNELAPAPATSRAPAKKGAASARTATLPAGSIGDGELILIEEAAEWEGVLRELSSDSLDVLQPDFSSERVALLGPAPGLSGCDALRVIETFDRIVVAWPTAPAGSSDVEGGCAVVIPANGLAVELGPDY
jgi:hypothetical protein